MSHHFPDDDALLAVIKDRVEEGRSTGIVLGVLDVDGTRRVVAYGDSGPGARPLGPESVFEIGSITKVFTGILLADMVARGDVELTASVQRYAPDGLTMPTRGGREITLIDLASHRSGLPRLPGNFTVNDRTNPYAEYSVAQMYEFLAGYELPREIGSQYEYSNLGVGLLGHVLAARAGVDYETLTRNRILDPLGMRMTGVALSPAMKAQLAIGHDAQGKPTALWDLPTLAGAGALRSNMHDMLTFLDANIGEPRSDLERAMRVSHRPYADHVALPTLVAGQPIGVGLAWHLLTLGAINLAFHNGGTGGYRSVICFDPARRVGVVLLTNSARDADDIALDLINRAIGLTPQPIARTSIQVPADILARYVGEYEYLREFTLTVTIKVTLEDGVLMVQSDGVSRVPIFAESETRFFARTGDMQFTFITDAAGVASRLVLHRSRFSRSVKKVR
jgi:D-alanyl-D-alanine-carboxypeptidase/D-alanyl-D-alanine-endopeptidase